MYGQIERKIPFLIRLALRETVQFKLKGFGEEEGELRDAGRDTDRMKALSDGVFAIAMTLLVFNLKVPELSETEQARDLGAKFLKQVPALIGFFIAFMILGVNWVVHTRIVRHLNGYDRSILVHNLFVLLFVALMPYATMLYGEFALGITKDDPTAAKLAWTIYASIASILAICQAALWRAAHVRGLVDAAVTPRLAGYISARIWVTVLVFVSSIAIAHYTVVFYATLTPALIPVALMLVHRYFSRMAG